jgi:hypothetical protein
LALGAIILLSAWSGLPQAAPAPAPGTSEKALPADEEATPALDPAKLPGNPTLLARAASYQKASQKNFQEIALAVHRYADANKGELPGDVMGKGGKALLSWRVRILPYFGEKANAAIPPVPGEKRNAFPEVKALHKQFKLDEPWDSKHNLALLEKMPRLFASPRVSVKHKGYTVYQVFSGPGALFRDGKAALRLFTIPDGTSNTILAVEASRAVPWTKPADVAYDRDKAVPDFGKAYGGRPLAAMADGSVRVLDLKKITAETLKNAIDPLDGNVLGKDWEE